jgi:ketosteroid isomerase-like protein
MSTANHQDPRPDLDPGILAAHRAYEAAINSNQTDRVMAMYDEGAAQMPPDSPMTDGWDQLRKAVDDYFAAYQTHWTKVVQAAWVSGDWGFDQGHDTAVDVARDGSGTTYYDCKGILIYKRQANGDWKVFRDIWNNNTPPRHEPAASPEGRKAADGDAPQGAPQG